MAIELRDDFDNQALRDKALSSGQVWTRAKRIWPYRAIARTVGPEGRLTIDSILLCYGVTWLSGWWRLCANVTVSNRINRLDQQCCVRMYVTVYLTIERKMDQLLFCKETNSSYSNTNLWAVYIYRSPNVTQRLLGSCNSVFVGKFLRGCKAVWFKGQVLTTFFASIRFGKKVQTAVIVTHVSSDTHKVWNFSVVC